MSDNNAERLSVEFVADTSQFTRDVNNAREAMDNFSNHTRNASTGTNQYGRAISNAASQSRSSASGFRAPATAIQQTGSSAASASKQVSAFSRVLKAAVATISVAAIVNFSKSCIELGSNLAEVQNVVDTTFTTMSAKVNEFAQNAAMTYGLSETMAKKYVSNFGAMAESMGFTEQQAYGMSTALTGLAGDVASFYNISQDEAYTKLKSVFTGETESLKELGVVMTQDNLQAFALSQGLNADLSSMSQGELVALRYQYVMQTLSNAQGDFARTSNSWANQTRLLSLQFDSFKANLGQAFISVLTPVIQLLNALMTKLVQASSVASNFFASLFGNASKASSAVGAVTGALAGATGGKISAPKISTPKVSIPKISAPKVSTPKVSTPKVSTPKVSTPKISTAATKSTSAATDNTVKAMKTGADSSKKIANNMDKASKKAKQIKKDLGSLSGIDQINNIAQKDSASDSNTPKVSTPKIKNPKLSTPKIKNPKMSTPDLSGTSPLSGLGDLGKMGAIDTSAMDNSIKQADQKIKGFTDKLKNYFKGMNLPKLHFDVDWNLVKNNIAAGLKNIWATFKNLLKTTLTIAIKIINDIQLDRLIEKLSKVFKSFTNLIKCISDAVCPAIINFYDRGISPLVQWIGEKLADAMDFVSDLMDSWAQWFTDNKDAIADFGGALGGVVSTLWDFIEPLADAVWETAKTVIKALSDVLQGFFSFIINNKDLVCTALTAIIAGLVAYKAAVAIAGIIEAFTKGTLLAAAAEKVMAIAQAALNLVMNANPIGLIIAAIAALVAGFLYLWNNCKGFREFWKKLWEACKNVTVAVGKAIVAALKAAWAGIKAAWAGCKAFFKMLWDGIKAIFVVTAKVLIGFFKAAWDGIKKVWSAVVNFFKGVWDGIKKIFSVTGKVLCNFFKAAWDGIKKIWSAVVNFFKGIWDGIKNIFSAVSKTLIGFFKAAWDGIKRTWSAVVNFFKGIWSGIKNAFSAVGSWFGKTFSNAYKSVCNVFKGLANFFKGIWSGIKNIFSGVAGWFGKIFGGAKTAVVNVFNGLVNIIKAPINGIVTLWNRTVGSIGFTIPSWVPVIGGSEFHIPQLPYLAKGGIVNGATPLIAGESGAEAIVPLESNTGWIDKVANKIVAGLTTSGGADKDINLNLVLKVGDTVFGKKSVEAIRSYGKQKGKDFLLDF